MIVKYSALNAENRYEHIRPVILYAEGKDEAALIVKFFTEIISVK